MRGMREVRRTARDEGGFTLVEVLVAMFVFAVISMSVIFTMLSTMSLSRDSRARQVATNLASQEIDWARGHSDPFALLSRTTSTTLNGDVFTVATTAEWVTDPNTALTCGAGSSAPLRYKRVNVRVTWDNMRASTSPVQSDTVINPTERINDPVKGTVIVSVLDERAKGSAGVTVSLLSGGSAVGSTTTDSQGCAYLLKVTPGDYTLKLAKSGYISESQETAPTEPITIVGGSSASVQATYAEQAKYTVTYASNSDLPGIKLPSNLPTSFISTYGIASPTTPASGNPRTFSLHPFSSGYAAIAGKYAPPTEAGPGCLSADPGAWPGGIRPPDVAAPAGGATTAGVPMGVVRLAMGTNAKSYVYAVRKDPPAGSDDPGCSETLVYAFAVNTIAPDGTSVIALPYGTWAISVSDSPSSTLTSAMTRATNTQITFVDTNGTINGAGATTTVTLDPRAAVVP